MIRGRFRIRFGKGVMVRGGARIRQSSSDLNEG